MYNANRPTLDELPTSAQLLRSTAIAAVAAGAILVTIVLPAEYGVDPTGAGRFLGLAKMGEIKEQLAGEAEADRQLAAATQEPVQIVPPPLTEPEAVPETTADKGAVPEASAEVAVDAASQTAIIAPPALAEPQPAPEPEGNSDEISITLSPGEGTEIKLVMQAGAKAGFEWTANGGLLNFDTHGDGGGQSISYEKGRGVGRDEGIIEAAFDGNHGWFWRNRTDVDVTMTLRTSGDYQGLKHAR